MKMSLFDDDRSSDDARSHSSILKQYLDLPEYDDIETMETVQEEEPVVVKRPVVRPKLWKVLNNYQLADTTSLVLPNRCCVDMGMFKGKSFKVGWSKGFVFLSVENDRESIGELNFKAIDPSQCFDPLKDILTDSLKIVLEESTHQLSSSKIPTFKVLKSNSYLKKQGDIFEKLATQYSSSQSNYLNSIWTLCKALWGPGENSISHRRFLVSEWLKSTCASDNLILQTGPFKSVYDATESIFTHLSVFKVLDAATLAMDARLPNLSLLISQLSLSNATKAFMQEQVEIWYKSLATNHISKELKRLYLLLAGVPIRDELNILEDVDWKRAFGIHLWYISPNGAPVETAIQLYEKAFKERLYAQRPNPPYCKMMEDGPYDVLYQILLLYKSSTHRLSTALNPATHTDDSLDYRLSWLLLQLFLSLDVGLIEDSEVNHLCTSFSAQLEDLGLWEWAVFVLLYLEDNSSKANLIMGILDRNLSIDDGDLNEGQRESVELVVNDMKLPPEWIHTVKGHKTMAAERYFEAFNHFTLAEEFVTANDIFVKQLLSNLFINEQYDVIRKLSDKLKPACKDILHWRNETGLILDYLDLLELSMTPDNLVKLQMKLGSLSDRIVNFPTESAQQKVCVAELSKRCASLYRELCQRSQSERMRNSYAQFIESLIMPADFKMTEGMFLMKEMHNLIGNVA